MSSVETKSVLASTCWWNTCQEETKAFSLFLDTKDVPTQTKLTNIFLTCVDNFNSIVREECEKDNEIDTFNSQDIFSKFYKCIDSCNEYHKKFQSCKNENQFCDACQKNASCITYKTQTSAIQAAKSSTNCPDLAAPNCTASLGSIAEHSCQSPAFDSCEQDYIKVHAAADDPCLPCTFTSTISPLIILVVLFSVLSF